MTTELEILIADAQNGNADAQYKLGKKYWDGQGIEKNYGEALRLFQLSAVQGNASGQNALGYMYMHGKGGIQQDYVTAKRWLKLSSRQRYMMAQYNLGVLYQEGKGMPQDEVKALKLYRLAASQNYENAKSRLKELATPKIRQELEQGYESIRDSSYYEATYTVEQRNLLFSLPEICLPMTPIGYKWVRESDSVACVLKKHKDAPVADFKIIIYGPENGKINYLVLIDGVNCQSYANARGGYKSRFFPISLDDYNDAHGKKYTRGHCIDRADTIQGGQANSNSDTRNYIPEPLYTKKQKSYWGGISGRNVLVRSIRSNSFGQAAYMQLPYYDDQLFGLRTRGGGTILVRNPDDSVQITGVAVPSGVYFCEVNVTAGNFGEKVYDIAWKYDPFLIQLSKNKTLYPKVLDLLQRFALENGQIPITLLDEKDDTRLTGRMDQRVALLDSCLERNSPTLANPARVQEEIEGYQTSRRNRVLHHLRHLAEDEYLNIQFKIKLALTYAAFEYERRIAPVLSVSSSLWHSYAYSYLKRAKEHALILQKFYSIEAILTEEEYYYCEKAFYSKLPVFCEDDQIDFFRQLYVDEFIRRINGLGTRNSKSNWNNLGLTIDIINQKIKDENIVDTPEKKKKIEDEILTTWINKFYIREEEYRSALKNKELLKMTKIKTIKLLYQEEVVAREVIEKEAANTLIDFCDDHGNTLLHYAARCGNNKAIEQLLEAGAYHKAENEEDETPIDVANNRDTKRFIKSIVRKTKQEKLEGMEAKLKEMEILRETIKQQSAEIKRLEGIVSSELQVMRYQRASVAAATEAIPVSPAAASSRC